MVIVWLTAITGERHTDGRDTDGGGSLSPPRRQYARQDD